MVLDSKPRVSSTCIISGNLQWGLFFKLLHQMLVYFSAKQFQVCFLFSLCGWLFFHFPHCGLVSIFGASEQVYFIIKSVRFSCQNLWQVFKTFLTCRYVSPFSASLCTHQLLILAKSTTLRELLLHQICFIVINLDFL